MTRNGAVATFGRAQKLKRVSHSRAKMKIVHWTGINVTSSGDNAARASTFPEHFPIYRRLLTDATRVNVAHADSRSAGFPPDCS